ncbi:MAG: DUF5657 family protein [Candidatus Levyibacteriota bacterium]
MNDALFFIQANSLMLLFKVLILILFFVYIIYTFIILNRVRALNRTIQVTGAHASVTLQTITWIFFLLAVSLFIATIVIV